MLGAIGAVIGLGPALFGIFAAALGLAAIALGFLAWRAARNVHGHFGRVAMAARLCGVDDRAGEAGPRYRSGAGGTATHDRTGADGG